MTPNEVTGLVMRSFRVENKREPTKDEIISVMAVWLSKWIRKDDSSERLSGTPDNPKDL